MEIEDIDQILEEKMMRFEGVEIDVNNKFSQVLQKRLNPKQTTPTFDAKYLENYIKGFEQYRETPGIPEKDTKLTGGWGHTGPDLEKWKNKIIPKEVAQEWFDRDFNEALSNLEKLNKEANFGSGINNDYKKMALVSLLFNTGLTKFKKKESGEETKSYGALKVGDWDTLYREAFDPEIGFVKSVGEINEGLQKRRREEGRLYLLGPEYKDE